MKLLLIALLLGVAWIFATALYLAFLPARSPVYGRLAREADDLIAQVPDGAVRESVRTRAERWAESSGRIGLRLPFTRRFASPPVLALASIRLAFASALLPVALAALLVGIACGLLRRHSLQEEFGFASVTLSYVGKMITVFSIAGYAITGLSPLGPPVWMLYPLALAGPAGMTLYFANLPPKI